MNVLWIMKSKKTAMVKMKTLKQKANPQSPQTDMMVRKGFKINKSRVATEPLC